MNGASTAEMFVRLALSLAVVVGLMWAGATMLRRRGIVHSPRSRKNGGIEIELLARRSLGRNSSVAVLRVGERAMVVGITDQNVTKLDDADVDEIDLAIEPTRTVAPGPPGPTPAWKTMLDQMRTKTVRR